MDTSSSLLRPVSTPAANVAALPAKIRNQRLAAIWGPSLTALSFFAIVFLTLFPFNFTVPHGMTLRQAASPFDWRVYDPSDPFDTINNIILFGPFGFALACLARGRNIRSFWLIPIAVGVSCLFACSIEFLQQWLPTRESALSDICSNSTGGFIGATAFLLFGMPLVRALSVVLIKVVSRVNLPTFAIVFACLLAVAVRGPLRMRHLNRNLSSWALDYPLSVGNDPHEDRAWQGSVTSIDIADAALTPAQVANAYRSDDLHALSADALLASYRIAGHGNCTDLTHHNPDLEWITSPAALANAKPLISGDHWLRSAGPMDFLCSHIRKASRFTVRCRFQSARQSQSPELGRIMTISASPIRCDLTIGQQNFDLVIRLRTMLSGENGTNPSLKLSDFFLQDGPHDLILTYDDPILRIYVDGPSPRGEIDVPADFGNVAGFLARAMSITFWGYLPEMYRGAFYLISFAPLGIVVGLLGASRRLDPFQRKAGLAIGVTVPTAVMQFVLVAVCRHAFRADNLVMGLAATAIVAIWAVEWLKRLENSKLAG